MATKYTDKSEGLTEVICSMIELAIDKTIAEDIDTLEEIKALRRFKCSVQGNARLLMRENRVVVRMVRETVTRKRRSRGEGE